MTKPLLISPELSPEHQLRQFCRFRWGLIGTELLAAVASWFIGYPVSSWPLLLLVMVIHALTNLILTLLPGSQGYSSRIFSLCCLADVLFISGLLALSGGAGNGLAAVLLLPVAVAAVLLPAGISYLLAVIAIAAYSLLLLPADIWGFTGPVTEHTAHSVHQHTGSTDSTGMFFGQHMLQMWWAFALSALLISWFVSSQAALIRKKSQQLNLLQQQQLRQEQVLVVATYAANAAHDLATPIQNISLLAEELAAELPQHEALTDLRQQVLRCQQIVQQLRQNAGQLRDNTRAMQPLLPLLQQSIQNWLVSRPEIGVSLQVQSDDSEYLVAEHISLAAALFNILDNAADAGVANHQPKLEISLQLYRHCLQVRIRDFGEGLSAQRLAELGKIPQQSEQGLGLGQFLANVSIEHLGGRISRRNLAGDGMETTIEFRAE
ncbi:HAMP domain-containing sensor histidine kinase [Chromatiaceae bacterium AAb-1]|nr:HAMP domain-containing sensor histidine kinase [Chromatiaceae bacterium AAb-1]